MRFCLHASSIQQCDELSADLHIDISARCHFTLQRALEHRLVRSEDDRRSTPSFLCWAEAASSDQAGRSRQAQANRAAAEKKHRQPPAARTSPHARQERRDSSCSLRSQLHVQKYIRNQLTTQPATLLGCHASGFRAPLLPFQSQSLIYKPLNAID